MLNLQASPRALDLAARPGYLHEAYASSLAEFGEPRLLPRSGAWILLREIPNSTLRDAMAGDRLLFCSDWTGLADDTAELSGLVSFTAVTDPLADVTPEYLRRCFPDLVRPYKDHYVVDLCKPAPSPHHLAEIRKARRRVAAVVETEPGLHVDDWNRLYAVLCARHSVSGIRAFSRSAFQQQMTIPGCVAIRAILGSECVSMTLWFVMGKSVYYHLGASDERGYAAGASYALIQTAIETFAGQGLRWLNLGSAAGASSDRVDGLTRFKRGWTDHKRTSYLCGKIIDRKAYRTLSGPYAALSEYFPLYRGGEFA
jgi:hypothetical protein